MSKSRYTPSSADRAEAREEIGFRNMHRRNTAEADLREQLTDATLAPAYEGRVGTRKHNVVLDTLWMPTRHEVEASSTLTGKRKHANVQALRERLAHDDVMRTMRTVIQHVVPQQTRMVKTATGGRRTRRAYEPSRYEIRDTFGGRYGAYVEG